MGQNQSNPNSDVPAANSFPPDKGETKINNESDDLPLYPDPIGQEPDAIDRIQAELPSMIDAESQLQVDDYLEACNKGKGPMVACFATGEFLSMFERKHKEAFDLYENVCFRPLNDKSPNGEEVDGGKAYAPGCFNLAKMLMTGKGGVGVDRKKAYDVFDRACRTGHGGACHIQAKILLSKPGALGKDIPYDPYKAMELYQQVCDTGDSVTCFTLATMLLRGDKINRMAKNASPTELTGEQPVARRTNEDDRSRKSESDDDGYIKRDPKRAEQLLLASCATGSHPPSCFNLAVMYENGDDGIPRDPAKAEEFKKKTEEMIQRFGGFGGT
jgi:TPR repeat protein